MEKNNLEDERNQDQDPGPSNRRQMSRTPVFNPNLKNNGRNPSQTKPLPPPQADQRPRSRSSKTQKSEEEEENANPRRSVRIAKRQNALTAENSSAVSDLAPITAVTQSVTPPSSSSPIEIAPSCGIMQLPEEVFQHILGFVTFDDTKAARLVNKQCRQMATTPLRRSSKEIKLDDKVFECVTKMDDGQFPVYRLEVQLYDDPQKLKVCHPYFSGICGWVKELTLKMDMDLNGYDKPKTRVDTDTFPRDCIYRDLTHFNLRLFEKAPNTRNPGFWKAFTDFVQSILRNSPNLREVSISYSIDKGDDLPICGLIEDVFPNTNSFGNSKLSCIDFQDVPLENIDLAKWFTLKLKLRKLAINVPRSSDLIDLLAVFLETQSGTLKELSLNVNRCDYKKGKPVTFTFPRMETLEQLGFTGWNKGVVLTFPGMDYVRLFPSLKKLDLRNVGIDWKDFLGNNLLEPSNSVEELIFPWTGRDTKPVVTAACLFPCLKKLEITVEKRRFMKALFENLPNLEVLSLIGRGQGYYSFDDYDHLITGVDMYFGDYESFRDGGGVVTDTWIQKLKAVEGRSLARLQNLKTLKLWNRSSRLVCFSRLSFHVFQQMGSLKCLDLNIAERQRGHRTYYDEKERQLLADLREKFVVF